MKTLRASSAAAALALLAIVGSAGAETLRDIRGYLGPGDPKKSDNSYYDRYEFPVSRGDVIRITMESDDFDAYLFALPPGGTEERNDDGVEGTTHSRLDLVMPEDGRLVVDANTLRPEATGVYRLLVERIGRREVAPPVAPPPAAAPAVAGGWIHGRLEAGDALLGDGSYVDDHWFEGTAGERVTVILESDDFDPYLLVDGPGLSQSNDDADGRNSRIVVVLPETGRYRARANSYGAGATGAYRLRIDRGGGASAAAAGTERPISVGQTVRGRLEAGDGTLGDGSYIDHYTFSGAAGQAVTIRLESTDFDPIVFLMGPGGFSESNDDGDGRNSVLSTVLPTAGRYTISANSYGTGAQTGAYILTLSPGAGPSPGGGAGSGVAAAGTRLRPGVPVENVLGAGDQTLSSGEYADAYVLEGRAGEAVAIDLSSSDFDPYLMVRGPNDFSEDNDDFGGDRSRSRLEFAFPADGTYRVVATSYRPGEEGRYRLAVTDLGERGGADVEAAAASTSATPLVRDQVLDGRLGPGDGTLAGGEYRDVYTFEGRRGEVASIEMTSEEVDAYLFLRGPGVQLDNDDYADGARDARIDVVLPANGTYSVVATSYRAGEAGAYRLRFGDPARAEVAAGGAPAGGRVWGIFVGITDYPPGVNDLERCADDARKVAEVLRRAGVSSDAEQRVLVDAGATRANLRQAFAEIAPRVGPDDVFVFFFSGHGSQSEDLPASRERDRREESIVLHDGEVSDDDLAALLGGVNARVSLVALDACFSGGFRNDLTRPEQMGLFSSEEDLTSAVPEKFQAGGYLSHFFREGLLGASDADGNDRVTAGELSEYLYRMFAAEVTGVEAETLEGASSYQHLVVDRGGVKVTDTLLSLVGVPESAKFHVVSSAGVRGAGAGRRAR